MARKQPNRNQRKPNRGGRRQRLRRQVRRERREAKSAANFRKPLTGKRARKVARAQAGREFNPVIRQIKHEREGSRKRQKAVGQEFAGLEALTNENLAASQALGASEHQATEKLMAEIGEGQAKVLEGLSEEEKERAAKLGGSVNSGLLGGIAAGQAATKRTAAALQAPIHTATAAHSREMLGQRGAHRLGGIEARKDEAERRDKIVSDLRSARRERGAATADRLQGLRAEERDYDIQQRAFTDEKPYEEAVREQAQLGLAGKRASARAQVRAARAHAGAKRRTAKATERASRNARKGKEASARGQVGAAKEHGKGGGGGYNVREAVSLVRAAGQDFQSRQEVVDYLVNRGVKRSVAQRAFKAWTGRGRGGNKRKVRPKGPRRTR